MKSMPQLDSIPLAWVQMNEGACLIDIIHKCMTLDNKRDTVALFNDINRQATEYYQRFFDSSFRPLPHAAQISEEIMKRDIALGLNNRAVMARFKV